MKSNDLDTKAVLNEQVYMGSTPVDYLTACQLYKKATGKDFEHIVGFTPSCPKLHMLYDMVLSLAWADSHMKCGNIATHNSTIASRKGALKVTTGLIIGIFTFIAPPVTLGAALAYSAIALAADQVIESHDKNVQKYNSHILRSHMSDALPPNEVAYLQGMLEKDLPKSYIVKECQKMVESLTDQIKQAMITAEQHSTFQSNINSKISSIESGLAGKDKQIELLQKENELLKSMNTTMKNIASTK